MPATCTRSLLTEQNPDSTPWHPRVPYTLPTSRFISNKLHSHVWCFIPLAFFQVIPPSPVLPSSWAFVHPVPPTEHTVVTPHYLSQMPPLLWRPSNQIGTDHFFFSHLTFRYVSTSLSSVKFSSKLFKPMKGVVGTPIYSGLLRCTGANPPCDWHLKGWRMWIGWGRGSLVGLSS